MDDFEVGRKRINYTDGHRRAPLWEPKKICTDATAAMSGNFFQGILRSYEPNVVLPKRASTSLGKASTTQTTTTAPATKKVHPKAPEFTFRSTFRNSVSLGPNVSTQLRQSHPQTTLTKPLNQTQPIPIRPSHRMSCSISNTAVHRLSRSFPPGPSSPPQASSPPELNSPPQSTSPQIPTLMMSMEVRNLEAIQEDQPSSLTLAPAQRETPIIDSVSAVDPATSYEGNEVNLSKTTVISEPVECLAVSETIAASETAIPDPISPEVTAISETKPLVNIPAVHEVAISAEGASYDEISTSVELPTSSESSEASIIAESSVSSVEIFESIASSDITSESAALSIEATEPSVPEIQHKSSAEAPVNPISPDVSITTDVADTEITKSEIPVANSESAESKHAEVKSRSASPPTTKSEDSDSGKENKKNSNNVDLKESSDKLTATEKPKLPAFHANHTSTAMKRVPNFDEVHKKLFDDMETIGEFKEKLEEKEKALREARIFLGLTDDFMKGRA